MNKKELLAFSSCREPEMDSRNGIIATSQIIIDESSEGKNIVEVDLWWFGSLKARWFGIKKEDKYAVYIPGTGWKNIKLSNTARIIQGKEPERGEGYYYCSEEYDWDSEEDEKRVRKELGTSVDRFESQIDWEKRRKAHERKMERVNDLIASIPAVPDDMTAWIHRTIFPENYLFANRSKKGTDYACTSCCSAGWTKEKWIHNQEMTCPGCGCAAIVKTRVQQIKEKERVTLLQRLGEKEWAERIFVAYCKWSKEGKHLDLFAETCAIIPNGKTEGKVYYGQEYDKDEFEQEWWIGNPINKQWGESFLYPGNLNEVLPVTGIPSSGIDIMAKCGRKFEVNKFIVTFRYRKYFEYLIKSGYMKMVADILRQYGWWEMPRDILNQAAGSIKDLFMLDGNRTNRIKQMDGGLVALEWLRYEEKTGCKISQETLEYLEENDISYYSLKGFISELGSVNRAVNYLKKQRVKPKTTIELWGDYLNMAKAEGLDTTDDIVRFPKDLKTRHDAMVDIINKRRDEKAAKKQAEKFAKTNKQICEHLPKTKIYFWENEEYIFIPAGKCEELVVEGRTLHHCVAASDIYMNRMAAGESWIVFLRKKECLEKPYYTLEIDMKTDAIRQWYSEYDRKPDEKTIRKLLTQYKNHIKSIRLKTAVEEERGLLMAAV